MNTENNNSANALIAEFMGLEVLFRPYSKGFVEISETEICDITELKYHSDWNWLMEVVEKIYSLSGQNKPYYGITFTMQNDTFQFGTDNQNEVGLNKHISSRKNNVTRINVVYNACVEFIKWYNQNK